MDPNLVANMMENPMMQNMMNQIISDPNFLNSLEQSNPMIRQMFQQNPMIRQMMQNSDDAPNDEPGNHPGIHATEASHAAARRWPRAGATTQA